MLNMEKNYYSRFEGKLFIQLKNMYDKTAIEYLAK